MTTWKPHLKPRKKKKKWFFKEWKRRWWVKCTQSWIDIINRRTPCFVNTLINLKAHDNMLMHARLINLQARCCPRSWLCYRLSPTLSLKLSRCQWWNAWLHLISGFPNPDFVLILISTVDSCHMGCSLWNGPIGAGPVLIGLAINRNKFANGGVNVIPDPELQGGVLVSQFWLGSSPIASQSVSDSDCMVSISILTQNFCWIVSIR